MRRQHKAASMSSSSLSLSRSAAYWLYTWRLLTFNYGLSFFVMSSARPSVYIYSLKAFSLPSYVWHIGSFFTGQGFLYWRSIPKRKVHWLIGGHCWGLWWGLLHGQVISERPHYWRLKYYRVQLKFCYGTKDDIETKWVIIIQFIWNYKCSI